MFTCNSSSFRDPSGVVLESGSRILRTVNTSYREDYTLFLESGLSDELLKRGWIPSFREVSDSIQDAWKVLEVERIPWISYPHEWSFHQLKEAALLTLRIQKKALEFGMSLKDASAYNIQLFQARPVFLDLQSFECYEEGKPWVARAQFVRHFLGPLLLMSQRDLSFGQMFRTWLDGFPIEFVSKMLPKRTHWSLSTLTNVHWYAKSLAHSGLKPEKSISKTELFQILDSLESLVKVCHVPEGSVSWKEPDASELADDPAFQFKRDTIARVCKQVQPQKVCDLSANGGEFSRQVPGSVPVVVSADINAVAVDRNYVKVRKENESNIYPLLLDVCNPTPGIGWMNNERKSFLERGRCDLVLGFSLIHHLCLGNHLPMSYVAEFFAQLAPRCILEFVPKDDPQALPFLVGSTNTFPRYTRNDCIASFSRHFKEVESYPIPGTSRTLFVFSK